MPKLGDCLPLFFILALSVIGCGQTWTEESAREKAFQNVKRQIDTSIYPSQDPDFEANQAALREGKGLVDDRFVSANPEPPIGYVVSHLDQNRQARFTHFYGKEGHLISVRLFSGPGFPRSAYIYCAEQECRDADPHYVRGELMSVSFHVSPSEVFYFNPEGHLNAHLKD